jgi:hypothetical protein
VHTILSLPAGCFLPYTGVKTNVVFFDRPDNGRGTETVWFYELSNDGFELKQTRKPIAGDQLPDFVAKSKQRLAGDNSWLVPLKDIAKRGFDLSARNPKRADDYEHRPALELIQTIRTREQRVLELLGELEDVLESLNDTAKAVHSTTISLGEVLLDTQNGRSIRSDGETGNGAVLTLSAVRSVSLDMAAKKAVSLDEDVAQKYGIKRGDVFISRSNTRELVGLSAVADAEPAPRTIFPDLLIRLTPDPAKLRPRYLAYALRFPDVRRQIQDRATGSSQSMVKISGKRLRELRIPLPTLEAQDSLIEELDEAHGTCASLQSALIQPEVDHLRTAILRQALTGGM